MEGEITDKVKTLASLFRECVNLSFVHRLPSTNCFEPGLQEQYLPYADNQSHVLHSTKQAKLTESLQKKRSNRFRHIPCLHYIVFVGIIILYYPEIFNIGFFNAANVLCVLC